MNCPECDQPAEVMGTQAIEEQSTSVVRLALHCDRCATGFVLTTEADAFEVQHQEARPNR